MNRSTLFTFVLCLASAAAVASAAGGAGPAADPTQAFELSGQVTAINAGSGSGMPMMTVDDAVAGEIDVALGPIWFLQAADFSAAVGDRVHLLAYPCPTCSAAAVAAWVENLDNLSSIDLRDELGYPLWTQRQSQRNGSGRVGGGGNGMSGGGQGSGSAGGAGGGQGGGTGGGQGGGQSGGSGNGTGSGPANGSGLDMTQVATVSGTVVSFTGEAGSDQPLLTLDADGEVFEIVVSPYAPVNAAGLVIEPGMALEVTFAPTDCEEDPLLIAISIVDQATGILVQLRDPETGFPMSGGGQHNRPNWP